MEQLTPRQEEILDMIRDSIQKSGMPPTRVEIARAFGFRSPNAAEGHLRALAKKGAIQLLPGASRGILLVEEYEESGGVPVIDQASASPPFFSEENIDAWYDINPYLFEPAADWLLTVSGRDMAGAGILDQDLLAVSLSDKARSGQVVVASLNGKLLVRRLKRNRKRETFLHSEGGRGKPVKITTKDDFEILGIGAGLIRNQKPL